METVLSQCNTEAKLKCKSMNIEYHQEVPKIANGKGARTENFACLLTW